MPLSIFGLLWRLSFSVLVHSIDGCHLDAHGVDVSFGDRDRPLVNGAVGVAGYFHGFSHALPIEQF